METGKREQQEHKRNKQLEIAYRQSEEKEPGEEKENNESKKT